MKMRITAWLFLLSLWMLATPVFGQTTTGSIYGTVADATGGLISKAPVKVTNVQTGETHTVPSNNSGAYLFPALDPGDYTVAVQFAGFQSQARTGIRLDANQNVHVNFALHPGDVSQTVTVDAVTTQVDTRESQLGQTVDQKQIEDLPLNGRSATSLAQLVPGVTDYVADTATGSRNGISFYTNGFYAMNSQYLDGAFDESHWNQTLNLLPNPDALQEFRVLTSNFDAEFGRTPGAVINAVTRYGSNRFHGLAYDYLRNTALNAKDYFTASVTSLHQNQFGGNFGGPILRNKAFFFGSYQGLIIHTPVTIASASLITPTVAEATGDFSAQPTKLWPKMSNGQYYSCNGVMGVICPNLLDPVAQNALAFVPLSTLASGGHPPQQDSNGNVNANQELARVDYQLSDRHKLSAMYFMSRGTQNINIGGNQILDYGAATNYNGQYNAVASDTWLVSSNKLNNLRFFYTMDHYFSGTSGNQPTLASLGSQAAEGGSPTSPPDFAITGYWTMGGGSAVLNDPGVTLGFVDTFNWSRDRHEIKAGGAFLWNRMDNRGSNTSNGVFTFTGSTTGNALADFLLGKANSLAQASPNIFLSHNQDPSLFIQDNYRLTQSLTLNLGIRWEAFLPWISPHLGTFNPNQQSTVFPTAPLGLLAEGDRGVPNGLVNGSWHSFAPRLGFAYDLFGDGRTAVRGAFGIFQTPFLVSQNVAALIQQPFALNVSIAKTPNLVTPFAPSADPFPYTPNAQNAVFVSGATLDGFPENESTVPYAQEYNFTVQHQFDVNWTMQAAYVGNTLRRNYYLVDINSPVYAPGGLTTTAGLNARRPYQPTPSTYTFGIIQVELPEANSSYNSLQTSLTRRLARGVSFQATYIWSKSLGLINTKGPEAAALTDQYQLSSARGLLPGDVRNRFVASYIWISPELHHLGLLGREALSGWQLNGITTLSTGAPFNITSGVDTNLDGVNNDRPNRVGNPNISGGRSRVAKIGEYFNTPAFQQLPAGTPYGNIPFDSQEAPPYINTDFSAFKNFPIMEKGTLQFRGELYNLFNYVNLNAPTAVLTSPSFGKISGDVSPRIVQFALRYSF